MQLEGVFMVLCALWWRVVAQEDLFVDGEEGNSLNKPDLVENVDHLREHMKDKINFEPDKMSRDEMQFHFFKLHDLDDDNRLDGLELMSAIRHGYEHLGNLENRFRYMTKIPNMTFDEAIFKWYSRQVDFILEEDDKNDDGYLTYVEYIKARRTGIVLDRAGLNKVTGKTK